MSGASHRSPLRRLRHVAGAILAVSVLAHLSAAPVVAGSHKQTKEQLERARARASELQDELADAREHVETVNGELGVITARVAEVTVQVEGLNEAITRTRQQIKRRDRRIDDIQSSLDARARAAYMAGPGAALELIFAAESLTDLSERLVFLEVLNDRDASLAAGLEVERRELTYQRADLDEYRQEKLVLLEQLRGEQAVLEEKQAEALAAAEDYQRKLEEAKNLVDRLEARYKRELRAAILAAQRAAAAAAAPASPGGAGNIGPLPSADGPFYACPVDRPRSYIDDFGYPRSGGRTHQGNDIFAPAGTPIRAPFAGTAEESYNSLGGTSVHVYGSNGDYVYNAHLSQHAGVDGQHVQPGDVIGYVGNTGNAIGTSPHDHFEYHPGGGSAVSPYVYLNEVCGVGGAG